MTESTGFELFEAVLKRDFDIRVTDGVEPAEGMAEIAKSCGMDVSIGTAENADFGDQTFDMLMFNGSTSYVKAEAGDYVAILARRAD